MPKVKICGITHSTEIAIMNELRPDYIGFVFVSQSRRFIAPEHAARLRSVLNPAIKAVGVFRNAPPKTAALAAETAGLSMIQLHGDETGEYIAQLREYTKCGIIQAFKISTTLDIERASNSPADYVLLDGSANAGRKFDWSMIPGSLRRNYFLAGGITPANVTLAAAVNPKPYALDISTGAEAGRLKDYRKTMQLIQGARGKC